MPPVIVISGIRVSILLAGGNLSTTIATRVLTFGLGLLARKIRDETNLLSAIYVQIAFNVGSAIGGIATNVISLITTGERLRKFAPSFRRIRW